MAKKLLLKVPINRVEGDLNVRVKIEDGLVSDAWSSGIMYRGFENLLVGRGPMDGLVLTPRICGICGTSHLTAAARALERIQGITPPPAAVRLRNVAMAVEKVQSDMRHAFLMFAVDFADALYRQSPFFDEAKKRYAPLKGATAIEALRQTKELLEIIAIIGGQWPHSSYMIPGGITSIPSSGELLLCRYRVNRFRHWYEQRVLGCSLARWSELRSGNDLNNWLEENEAQRNSEAGLLIRFSRHHGLDKMGRGYGNFISFGLPIVDGDEPEGQSISASGFAQGTAVSELQQAEIREYVDHSWYMDETDGRHPFEGQTRPYATGQESRKYSWFR